jgi:hypothetical protein
MKCPYVFHLQSNDQKRVSELILHNIWNLLFHQKIFYFSLEHSECKAAKNASGNSVYSGTDYRFPILLILNLVQN